MNLRDTPSPPDSDPRLPARMLALPAWPDPVQDARGNMTSFPKPFDPANGFSAVYDAWNRMVEVKSGQITVGRYHFDGLNRRIRCDSDSQSRPGGSPDGVDTYQHCYFNTGWQMLETRRTSTSGDSPESIQPECQYVWSARYIDAMILRDRDAAQGGDQPDHRFRACRSRTSPRCQVNRCSVRRNPLTRTVSQPTMHGSQQGKDGS